MFNELINKIKNMAKKKATKKNVSTSLNDQNTENENTSFSIGDVVNFKRNEIVFTNDTKIIAQEKNYYIVENKHGWNSNDALIKKYNVEKSKKYLFVTSNELTKI